MRLSKFTQDIFNSLYRDVLEFRNAFGLPIADQKNLDDQDDILHTALVIEELTELAEAKNKIEQADAIVDSVYVLVGRLVHLAQSKVEDNLAVSYLIDLLLNISANCDIDFIPCWNEIHSSNMSKACRNQREHADTEAFYTKQGIKLISIPKNGCIIVKCAEDFVSNVKTINKNKILKSVYYRPPNLEPFLTK
ncbi:conserved conserved hypothetical protein [Candidatus Photodesmus blepharus]|uniref:Phosphoribosyl-ATP pyrophosphohydrolase n=1 Tax=Candidatus Photodesmus blepharonis TaxID=1179155 RepID=A0A084CPL0_9GAMM|nr:nucleoside triphosphate pyrophosphohydrolase family protein [Candidatus Photodesmus blepharus]KEY91739.1 conserved conserved hypothetical protein [Candidatus Photodesmus blepharus]